MIRYRNNTKIYTRREITPFVNIYILITHMTWFLLTQVQEIKYVFGLEFTLTSRFKTMEMWSYHIWIYSLLPTRKCLSLNFLSRHWYNFFHSLTLLIYISLWLGILCPLLDNMNTLFFTEVLVQWIFICLCFWWQ